MTEATEMMKEDMLHLQASKENHWKMNKARWDVVRNAFMPVVI